MVARQRYGSHAPCPVFPLEPPRPILFSCRDGQQSHSRRLSLGGCPANASVVGSSWPINENSNVGIVLGGSQLHNDAMIVAGECVDAVI
jgi:hypothetical protein